MAQMYSIYIALPPAEWFSATKKLDAFAQAHFPGGWTRLDATGGWAGVIEPAVVYQVVLPSGSTAAVLTFAQTARERLNQESVLIVEQVVSGWLVRKDGLIGVEEKLP